jgi:hypothetical protein
MKIVSAHQPAFCPWAGLLHKVILSDIFIFMDIAKFRKRAFMHRNRIEINGIANFFGLKINDDSDNKFCHEIYISNFHSNIYDELYKKIELTYKNYPYYKDLNSFLILFLNKEKKSLNDLCLWQLELLCNKLEIDSKIIKESDIISFEESKLIDASNRLLRHAKFTKADIYITGINSKDYLDKDIFIKNSINHFVQEFDYKIFLQYQKCQEPLSVIHQIATIGFEKIKLILHNQISKNQIINKIHDRP